MVYEDTCHTVDMNSDVVAVEEGKEAGGVEQDNDHVHRLDRHNHSQHVSARDRGLWSPRRLVELSTVED